jgi:hypothetical protein
MTAASDEKWRPFNCFFCQVGLRTYQHCCTYGQLMVYIQAVQTPTYCNVIGRSITAPPPVIAQQYSAASFAPPRFQSRKEIFGAHFLMLSIVCKLACLRSCDLKFCNSGSVCYIWNWLKEWQWLTKRKGHGKTSPRVLKSGNSFLEQ